MNQSTEKKTDPSDGLEVIRSRACALPFADENYIPPTSEEVRLLISAAGWSQREAAMIVGVSYSIQKGSPTIRKWKSPVGTASHREIPYASWRLFLIHAGCDRS